MNRTSAGKASEYTEGACRLIQVGRHTVSVFRIGGELYAIDDMCPHRAGPLSEGKREGTEVECPWHGSRFDLKTGKVLKGPSQRDLIRFGVETEGNEVFVLERLP